MHRTIVSSLADQILLEAEADYAREHKFSEDTLHSLYSVFGNILPRALELMEKDKFIQYQTEDASRKAVMVGSYTLFPCVNFCPCPAFRYQVLGVKNVLTCKHVLAVRLLQIMDKIDIKVVTGEQIMNFFNAGIITKFLKFEFFEMNVLFCAELNDVRSVNNILKAIAFKEFANVQVMKEGLKVTVEEMKSVQTSAYVPKEVFSLYMVNDDDVQFKISLKILTECLSIYGDDRDPSLKILYKDEQSPLALVLENSEEHITADCEIRTIAAEDLADLHLPDDCSVNNIIVNAEAFENILNDLDNTADTLEILMSPDAPFFQITTVGMSGECRVDLSKHSDHVVSFRCAATSKSRYVYQYIKQISKVLHHAKRVSISTGETGLLGVQLVFETDERKQMYVEYYVNALLPDD